MRSYARAWSTTKRRSCSLKRTTVRHLSFSACLVQILSSDAVLGLKATMETIDNRADFKVWMHSYVYAHGGSNNRGPRRNGPQDEGFVRRILPYFFTRR